VRTLADTMISTRVFNEGGPAFRAVLDDIVARGIRLVVIAGDLTDDGQA
jgi:3',5'-cyclic AMP phosphodiesterase CpdA